MHSVIFYQPFVREFYQFLLWHIVYHNLVSMIIAWSHLVALSE